MIVTGSQLQRFSRALRHPLRTAATAFHVREGLVLMLHAGEHAGLGECTPLVEFGGAETVEVAAQRLVEACEWVMARTVPEEVAELDAWLDDCPHLRDAPASRHAVEGALLDLIARQRGEPLRCLLHEHSRALVTVNALLTAQTAVELAEQGRTAVRDGFGTLKVKVGAGPLALDVERLGALRAIVGRQIRIRIDANGAWKRHEASEVLRKLSAFDLELCEQPVAADDLEGLAELHQAGLCRIAADEALDYGTARRLLQPAACSLQPEIFVLRPMRLGGLLRTVRLGWTAHAAGIDVFIASSLEGSVGRAAAVHAAAALPDCGLAHGLATGALFADEPPSPLSPVDGAIRLDDSSGLGLAARRAA